MYRILYVDDEPDLLTLGKLFLEEFGPFSVDLQSSATAALEYLTSHTCDAIISDYQMAGMDGIGFLKQVRASGNSLPFILFTGRGREEVVIQALNEGADYYLQKGGEPVAQFTELAHKIRQAIKKREADISIRNHEKREADIISFLPDATFAIDSAGTVIAWNHAMELMTGVERSQMMGKGDYEYSLPFYGERRPILIDLVKGYDEPLAQQYPGIVRDGNTYSADVFISRFNNGNGAYFRIVASPLCDSAGNITGAIESVRDISSRVRVENTLKEREERYRTVFENTGSATMVIVEDCTIILANKEFARLSGYSTDEINGKIPWTLFVVPEDRERMLSQHILRRQQPGMALKSYEFRFVRRNGEVRDISAMIDIIPGTRTSVASLVDITERKRAAEALKLENQRMESLLALSLMGSQDSQEILARAVEDAIRLTGSRIGYLATLDDRESVMTMQYWSRSAHASCTMPEKPLVYPVEKTGLWGEAVRQRRPVITNDYEAGNPYKRGTPPGHVRLVRHMNIPVFENDRIVAIAGVGNKETLYDEGDVRQLQLLMQGWWQIVIRKRAEETSRLSGLILRAQLDISPDAILIVGEDRKVICYNQNFLSTWKIPPEIIATGIDELVLESAAEQTSDPESFVSRVNYLYEHRNEKSSEQLVLRDGRVLERFSSPMWGREGQYFGRVWFSRDITKKREPAESA